jgi:hypothetical protein
MTVFKYVKLGNIAQFLGEGEWQNE